MPTAQEKQTTAILCPVCGVKGRKVPAETVPAMVKSELRNVVRDQPYRFCESPRCDVVYFSEPDPEHRFAKSDVRVRVGLKETEPPLQVCYCFDWTAEDIEQEIRWTGTTTIPDRIRRKVQEGLCHCETMNPQGTCCLGNVSKAVKEAEQKLQSVMLRPASSHSEAAPPVSPPGGNGVPTNSEPNRRDRRALLASAGAVFSSVVASACCWLPLLLVAIGVSGVGIAGIFEQYRPIFLTGTFALLALAWYLTYQATIRRWPGRRPVAVGATSPNSSHACCAIEPDEETAAAAESCCMPAVTPRRFTIRQLNKGMLWIATAIVLVFVLFPHWIGFVLHSGTARNQPEVTLTWHNVRVEGMTCEGCAATLEKAIGQVPGVREVHVSYQDSQATIGTEAGAELPEEEVLAAIEKAGYQGELIDDPATPVP